MTKVLVGKIATCVLSSFLLRACFQTHHISLLPKFWLVFWQNFLQYARYSSKILPKSRKISEKSSCDEFEDRL
ncbi:MAG: hypothetical protein A3G22_06490 [Alphaproteobacteria bacterium RIFCSPLOWO2_12_FULL_40_11]|nr:MAG: hypothetical protein A3H30_05330 [Alphaproteobacteria bacterium RIFCSPLOWO2_02_FULL_40_19]OFX11827.1 MAG: hypothetical protein A3G22_06490 [Alphaproteobacteria bacterium RIFCSPLOWO2_12_FULL_40_11]